MFRKILNTTIIFCFIFTAQGPIPLVQAQDVNLPAPGTMINLSPAYEPVMIKGLTVHKDNPFLFDFIVDVGQDRMSGEPLKKEGEKLIKYFLASLAIPDKDVWVNLSPYEKQRMIPEALGQTDMGRDLLEQDYILKQITASLIYPEKQLGKTFWDTVYAKAQEKYGTTQIPVNTFNKVWIMADKAEVFEHNQTAFVVSSHLKVMLEEDYLALQKHTPIHNGTDSIGANIVREIILPQLEKEVNTGKNFANLRQIFNSIILSSWYKKNLKEALLNQVYANQSKINGINLNDPTVKQQIYEQYLKAYKKGVFNYIKEDVNNAGESIPRKYFSGGITNLQIDPAQTTNVEVFRNSLSDRGLVLFETGFKVKPIWDAAMSNNDFINEQIRKLEDNYFNYKTGIKWTKKVEESFKNAQKALFSIEEIRIKLKELVNEIDRNDSLFKKKEMIFMAINLLFDKQGQQLRLDAKFYPVHPIKVALILINDFGVNDPDLVIAALLHDFIEDVDEYKNNPDLIGEQFGIQVQANVESVTNAEMPSQVRKWLIDYIKKNGHNLRKNKDALKDIVTIIEYQLNVIRKMGNNRDTFLLKTADLSDKGGIDRNSEIQARLASKYRDLIPIVIEDLLSYANQEYENGDQADEELMYNLRQYAFKFADGNSKVSKYAQSWKYARELNSVAKVIKNNGGLRELSKKIQHKINKLNKDANGGIDLNTTSGMGWKIIKDGSGVEMNIDPAMVESIKRHGVESLSPVILRVTPIYFFYKEN